MPSQVLVVTDTLGLLIRISVCLLLIIRVWKRQLFLCRPRYGYLVQGYWVWLAWQDARKLLFNCSSNNINRDGSFGGRF